MLKPAARWRPARLVNVAVGVLFAMAAPAALADVLDTVLTTGVLRVAVVLDYPPFGSVDASLKPQGYDIEFADMVARSLGVKAELVAVTGPTKIPSISAGKADLLLNIGRNAERAKVVDFSQPYAPYYIGIFGPADQKASGVADLAGKKVSVTRGSFEDQLVTRMAPPATQILRFEDNNGTISAFLSGQADMMSIGNIVAAAILEMNPPRRPEQKFLLLNSPVHAAVMKGELRLLERVNTAIAGVRKDGSLGRMSERLLKQPLPDSF
jgi:polar amino acid transport system substrate-binding protein